MTDNESQRINGEEQMKKSKVRLVARSTPWRCRSGAGNGQRIGQRRHSVSIFGLALLIALPLPSSACGAEPFLGEICLFGFTFCPRDYADTSGQLLPIAQNQALFSLLGTLYGGDGRVTFALPDLRGRTALDAGAGPGLSNINIGETGGAESTTLGIANLPNHSHSAVTEVEVKSTLRASSEFGDSAAPGNRVLAASSQNNQYASGRTDAKLSRNSIVNTADAVTTIGATGSGAPFALRQPYIGLHYCIALQGIFPSRD